MLSVMVWGGGIRCVECNGLGEEGRMGCFECNGLREEGGVC